MLGNITKMQVIPKVKTLYKQVSKDVLQPARPFINESWHARFIDRKLSIYLTWLLLHTKISPNQITASALLMSGIGAFFLSLPNLKSLFLGVLFYQLYILLDNSDGEVARFTQHTSESGVYMDNIMHRVSRVLILIALSMNIYNRSFQVGYLIFGLIAAVLSLISALIYLLDPYLNRAWFDKPTRGGNKLLYYVAALNSIVDGEIEKVYILLIFAPLFYLGLIKIDPFQVLLFLNFVIITANITFNVLRKAFDKRYQ